VDLTLTAYFISCWLRRNDNGNYPVSTCSAEAAVEQKAPHFAIRKALFCITSDLFLMLSQAELYARSNHHRTN